MERREIPKLPGPVVFFDGVCGGCSRFVDFVMAADAGGEIMFSPAQGETAGKLGLFADEDPGDWAIAYVDESGIHEGADAVFAILARLGGFWRIPALAAYLPGPLKGFLYGAVARRRYRVFGRRDSCRSPTPGERERFLP